METSVVLEFTIAALAGLILATLVTPIKRALPYWFETALWLGLIVACWIAITGIAAGNPRDILKSALWGAQQIVATSIGLLLSGLAGWIVEQRFVIASAVLLIVGADLLVLALLFSRRNSRGWQPQVRLQEWFEYPVDLKPARATAVATQSPFEGINRSGVAAASVLGAASATWFTHFLIWTRDVVMPNVAAKQAEALAAGRLHAMQLEAKAREWRAAHAPAFGGSSTQAGEVVDVQALRDPWSTAWLGAEPLPPAVRRHTVEDEGAQHDSDRLAS
jgi:hypothetical protein